MAPGSVQDLILIVADIDAARDGADQPRRRRQRGLARRGPGNRADACPARPGAQLVPQLRVVQRPRRQRLAAAGDHGSGSPAGNETRWTSRLWPSSCTRRPSITARSRRSPRRTTGGTGTRRTWTLASAGAPGRGLRGGRALHGGGQARRRPASPRPARGEARRPTEPDHQSRCRSIAEVSASINISPSTNGRGSGTWSRSWTHLQRRPS